MQKVFTKNLKIENFTLKSQTNIIEFICSLCKGILWDPICISTGYTFCKSCFYEFNNISSFSQNNEPLNLICPLTSELIDPNKIFSVNFINEFISKEIIYCKNKNSNCEWEGKLKELKFHLENECLKELKKCSFKGCEYVQNLENLERHKDSCEFKINECNLCGEKLDKIERENHSEKCKKIKIFCLNDCGIYAT